MAAATSYADVMIARAEAAGDTAQADYWRDIRSHVDEAPPLSNEQAARLRILLAPTVRAAAAA